MTDLRHEHSPEWEGRPPRMSRNDYAIWTRYRKTAMESAIKVWYDVGIGEGRREIPDVEPAMKRMWIRNTQYRADAIIEYENSYTIFEIREAATADVIGRILIYKILWDKEKPTQKPTDITVVTNIEQPSIREVATERGIGLIVV